jgi:hypothetical protein
MTRSTQSVVDVPVPAAASFSDFDSVGLEYDVSKNIKINVAKPGEFTRSNEKKATKNCQS